tara:strand:- start:525 stop:644 length:120 start_codon:yes stop_codon:yes gene_type:complete
MPKIDPHQWDEDIDQKKRDMRRNKRKRQRENKRKKRKEK